MAPSTPQVQHPAVAKMDFVQSNRIIMSRPIHTFDEFKVGRPDIAAATSIVDWSISKHHFKVYCIQYDEEEESVSPMVYIHVLSRHGMSIYTEQNTHRFRLTQIDGPRLLNTGDALTLSSSITVFFTNYNQAPTRCGRGTLICSDQRLRLTDSVIGSGAFAQVIVAFDERNGKQFACKVLQLHRNRQGSLCDRQDRLAREIEILKAVNHPNIISLYGAVFSDQELFLLQDLAVGGDLLSYQQRHGKLQEPEVICIVYQLVQAIHYLHISDIVHRDIKPENILLMGYETGARVVLADFGQARFLRPKNTSQYAASFRMESIAGTVGWQAPELQATDLMLPALNYGKAVDMWSLGAVTLVMFTCERYDERHRSNYSSMLKVASELEHSWPVKLLRRDQVATSPNASAFIDSCLQVDETNRMQAVQAIEHPWLTCTLYSKQLREAYERVIRVWQPRLSVGDIVEFTGSFTQDQSGPFMPGA